MNKILNNAKERSKYVIIDVREPSEKKVLYLDGWLSHKIHFNF